MQSGSSTSARVFYPKLNQERIIEILTERLEGLKLKLPLVRVVLFGSYAKGNYTVGSDIDLLVVYEGKPRDDAYAIVKKILGIPRLEPHIYTEDEYKSMGETLSKMAREGIVLFPKAEEG